MGTKVTKRILSYALVLMLAFGAVSVIGAATSYADDEMTTDQGMDESVSDEYQDDGQYNDDEQDDSQDGDDGFADENDGGGEEVPSTGQEQPDIQVPIDTGDAKESEEDEDTILIRTEEDLRKLADAINTGTFIDVYGDRLSDAKVALANDIVLSDNFTPIGWGGYSFKGEFDGNGFTISNLTIEKEGPMETNDADEEEEIFNAEGVIETETRPYMDNMFQGLFGVLGQGAIVHDVNLKNVQISAGAFVGGIAGLVEYAEIRDCTVEGNIISNDNLAGGIAGAAIESTIAGCATSGTVTARMENAGGIVGQAAFDNCIIRNCNSSAVVSVEWAAGGIAGSVMSADIEGCGFTGELVCPSDDFGNIAGYVYAVDITEDEVESEYERMGVDDANDYPGGSTPPARDITQPESGKQADNDNTQGGGQADDDNTQGGEQADDDGTEAE